MKVHLLYEDREWSKKNSYFDTEAIIEDLNLGVLFKTAARNQEEQTGTVQALGAEDKYLAEVMEQVMMVPLRSREEIIFRQDVLKDCLAAPEQADFLYHFSDDLIFEWDKLGRKDMRKDYRETNGYLITRMKMLYLFLDRLAELKEYLAENREQLHSEGFQNLLLGLEKEFGEEDEAYLRQLLKSLAFFCEGEDMPGVESKLLKPVLELECTLSGGFKLERIWPDVVESTDKKYKKEKRQKTLSEKFLGAFVAEPSVPLKEDVVLRDLKQLEYAVVRYVMGYLEKFYLECQDFFEQLYFQSAFYFGACRIYRRMKKMTPEICFPKVCDKKDLSFKGLKECSMAMARRMEVVGNDADIRDKMLLIVTGANQGGKSTFLRSIGIAQIMMQCGLFVSAEKYESGIFTGIYTHFTRREDVQMNSGRLDEELSRMEQMILHLEPDSLMLLNESFATTTEQEGSEIAYDIILALLETGVKVLTVTHLLSFAKKCYNQDMREAEYLSAERLEDGERTFKMVQGEPELTSFGLDLYEEIIGEDRN